MIRSAEYREAKATVKRLDAAQRKARKAEALKLVKVQIESILANKKHPRERDNAHLAFVRRLPCIACGDWPPSQAAHVRSGYSEDGWAPTGMAQKPSDWRTLPLCGSCHLTGPKAQHKANERAWWERLGIHPPSVCTALYAASGSLEAGVAIVRAARPEQTADFMPGLTPKDLS